MKTAHSKWTDFLGRGFKALINIWRVGKLGETVTRLKILRFIFALILIFVTMKFTSDSWVLFSVQFLFTDTFLTKDKVHMNINNHFSCGCSLFTASLFPAGGWTVSDEQSGEARPHAVLQDGWWGRHRHLRQRGECVHTRTSAPCV